jgi:BON domain
MAGRRQHHSPEAGSERFQGQYEKDAWRSERPEPPPRGQASHDRQGADARDVRGSGQEEPYEPSEGYEPFEPGHPREEGTRFGAGPPPRYFGTGIMGHGGSPEPDWRTERRYPPGPKGYQRSDERLREDISERLMEARHIDSSDVTVKVSAAKVVLEGTVPERRMKHAIEDLVDACPGVQDIDNRIRVRR